MLKKDFLLKQIEDLGKFLGALLSDALKLKTENQIQEPVTVDQQFLKEFGITLSAVLQLGKQDFLKFLESKKELEETNLIRLADFLMAAKSVYSLEPALFEEKINWIKEFMATNKKVASFSFLQKRID